MRIPGNGGISGLRTRKVQRVANRARLGEHHAPDPLAFRRREYHDAGLHSRN
jgi:hypothetical protein